MSKNEQANLYADLIIKEKLSLREVAERCNVSKSTVHKYVSKYTTGWIRKMVLRSQLRTNKENGSEKGLKAIKDKRSKCN